MELGVGGGSEGEWLAEVGNMFTCNSIHLPTTFACTHALTYVEDPAH